MDGKAEKNHNLDFRTTFGNLDFFFGRYDRLTVFLFRMVVFFHFFFSNFSRMAARSLLNERKNMYFLGNSGTFLFFLQS